MSSRSSKSGFSAGKMILALLALVLLGVGGAVPFVYESQSLYYKFGGEKALLQWGKMSGALALVLMAFQVLLMSRFSRVDRILGITPLFSLHRFLGVAIALLVLAHPLLILWSEKFTFFPLELRYWPEFLGIAVAGGLVGLVGMSLFRARLNLSYSLWLLVHRLAAPAVILAAFVHAGTVSETFDHPVPRYGLILLGGTLLALVARRIIIRRKSPPQ